MLVQSDTKMSGNVIVSSLYEGFKAFEDVDDRLLWHWFKSPDFQKLIMQLQEGLLPMCHLHIIKISKTGSDLAFAKSLPIYTVWLCVYAFDLFSQI